MIYPFIYWATVPSWEDDVQFEERSGCTFAASYAEAMKNIEGFYGEDLISIKMEALEENAVLEFHNPKEADEIVADW